MMGISSDENGILTTTDFDKIEISNLNRQFLFRENNIGYMVSIYYTKMGQIWKLFITKKIRKNKLFY